MFIYFYYLLFIYFFSGFCRRSPDSFLRDLEKLNEDFDLSRLLCECREPDLLADIIRSQVFFLIFATKED